MAEDKQQDQSAPRPAQLEEQDLDKAVGGVRPRGGGKRTACPCDGGE